MSVPGLRARARSRAAALAWILACSVVLNSYHLQWGLPNGNATWAADAVTPMTPFAVAKKSLAGRKSGWFYFKYPIGHPLLMLAAYAPSVALLSATGGYRTLQSQYPYGFTHPERVLAVFALIGRAVSVLMATATVAIVYGLGATLFEPAVGVMAAAAAACSMGLIFYAHTTNLDVPVTFWMLLALLCAVRLMRAVEWRECLGLGLAAGMGFATKESAVGILIALPVLVAGAQLRRLRPWSAASVAPVVVRLAVGAVLGVVVYGIATNAIVNPIGMVNRWRYLTGTLPKEYFGTLVPRAAYIDVTHGPSLATHARLLRELATSLVDAVGIPLITAALCGVLLAIVRTPGTAALLLSLCVTYYYFALAALPLGAVRYVLPVAMLLMPFAGVFLVALDRLGRVGRVVTAGVVLTAGLYGASVDYLLVRDPRYAAEAWLQEHARGHTVETYNRATFLPRFPAQVSVSQPKFTAVTITGLAQRRPDFILLNMADIGRVTGRYDLYEVGVKRRPENEAFLRALLAENLGYHRVARFRAWSPLIRDDVIRSLNPEIVVFARS